MLLCAQYKWEYFDSMILCLQVCSRCNNSFIRSRLHVVMEKICYFARKRSKWLVRKAASTKQFSVFTLPLRWIISIWERDYVGLAWIWLKHVKSHCINGCMKGWEGVQREWQRNLHVQILCSYVRKWVDAHTHTCALFFAEQRCLLFFDSMRSLGHEVLLLLWYSLYFKNKFLIMNSNLFVNV